MKLRLYGFLIFGLFLPFSAQAADCDLYWNDKLPVRPGFAAAFNVFSPSKQLITVNCFFLPYVYLTIGNGDKDQAIYKVAYLSKDAINWTSIPLFGDDTTILDGKYFIGSAHGYLTLSYADLQSWNYIGFVVAYFRGTHWKYGCINSTCAVQGGWNLQAISMPAVSEPEPNGISFSPAEVGVSIDASIGTVLTSISVSMSDGVSPFTGLLELTGCDFLEIVDSQIVTSRELTESDIGIVNIVVTATQ